jgi:hypothetical protein
MWSRFEHHINETFSNMLLIYFYNTKVVQIMYVTYDKLNAMTFFFIFLFKNILIYFLVFKIMEFPNVIKLMLFMGQRYMSLCCCLYYLHQEHVTWIFVWSYMCCLLDLECHSYNIITNNMIRQLNLCWISCDGVLASVKIFKNSSKSKCSCSSSPTKFALK